jgi:hypothetical protein
MGVPKAELSFKLINTGPVAFVREYQFSLPQGVEEGLVLLPKEERIIKTVNEESGQQMMNLFFENDVVGQGKAREFGLEFNATHFLTARGLTRTIAIPTFFGAGSFSKYQTQVNLPTNWGEPTTVTPAPISVTGSAGRKTYVFNQNEGEIINVIYGEGQTLQFAFGHTLTNLSNSPAYQELILPSDKQNLQIIYANLTPSPASWHLDDQGDWHAYYLLGVGEEVKVMADGYLIYAKVQEDLVIEEFYPNLEGELKFWHTEAIPVEFLDESLVDKVATEVELKRFGVLPLLNYYQVTINNLSGRTINNLQLQLNSTSTQFNFKPTQTDFTLMPWQKSEILIKVSNRQWWPPYQNLDFSVATIYNYDQTLNYQDVTGLIISYPIFVLTGGLIAAMITVGSILIARKK